MFKNLEGQTLDDVNFVTRIDGQFKNISSSDIFKGKSVIIFSLPGAFTPTCSSSHLPRYNQLARTFKNEGVDEVICISVNDAFVMEAWARDQKAENIRFLPDGNGDFSQMMGLLVDKNELGFGKRSWRYSMHVVDGVVKKMFIEPDKPGDPFEVSDADTMLKYLSPEAKIPQTVSLFTKIGCPYCVKAKKLLVDNGYEFEEIVLGAGINTKSLYAISGKYTVPQVFIDGRHIGGSEELEQYFSDL